MSPAVSSVIMIAAVMVLVLVATSYASNILDTRLAENEFASNKQFMLTTGLQIDDVSWTVGRTQTITYANKFGNVKFQSLVLNYSVDMHSASGWESVPQLSNITTGMIMYNMPIGKYNLGNNYTESISPRNSASFLQQGPTALVSRVFIIEQVPMTDGNFIRIAAVPSVRVLNSSIVGPSQSTTTVYCKFFLPTLKASAVNPALFQSITMVGTEVTKVILKGVDQIRITVGFPSAGLGFNSTFFGFARTVETYALTTPGSVVEFYVGNVVVSMGQA
jgi:hypothetical protein